jgi:hypothetical protein
MKQADKYLAESETRLAQGDWTTAISLVRQVQDQVMAAVKVQPMRTGIGGAHLDLRPRLEQWEDHGHQKLLSSLSSKSRERVHAAYTELRLQCVSCHTALGKSDIAITNWPAP